MNDQNGNGAVAESVQTEFACPCCGERDPDCLVWADDEADDPEVVTCVTCGTAYRPCAR